LRTYSERQEHGKPPILIPDRKSKALMSAIPRINSKEFLHRKPPYATAYELEKELNLTDGTLRYHLQKFIRAKIITKRRKLYCRKEIVEVLNSIYMKG
jgi:DNA-binding MarR family transcriptional regulator